MKKLLLWWREFKCRNDLHDYMDSDDLVAPMHFYTYTCKHCGKKFEI